MTPTRKGTGEPGRPTAPPGTHGPPGRPAAGPGFTLVELLVALIVLQVGVLSLVAVVPLTQARVMTAEIESEATRIVRQGLEGLGGLPYEDPLLAPGGPYSDPDNPIEGSYQRTWSVTDDQPIEGCKTVTVQVNWTDPRGARQVQASTVVSSY